jgi:hypothetical protein
MSNYGKTSWKHKTELTLLDAGISMRDYLRVFFEIL